jgi:hypothetical protein
MRHATRKVIQNMCIVNIFCILYFVENRLIKVIRYLHILSNDNNNTKYCNNIVEYFRVKKWISMFHST